MEELIEVTMEELMSYSKQKEVPPVTIIDDLTKEQFDYISNIADRLRLLVILIHILRLIGLTKVNLRLSLVRLL